VTKPIRAALLRELTLAREDHPRRQGYISAASGLVCAYGKAYVISDDEHHLAVFSDAWQTGELFRLLTGDLPQDGAQRKLLKPDFESLFLLPKRRLKSGDGLVALGSGSKPNRDQGVYIALNSSGEPSKSILRFPLTSLYSTLNKIFGEINIEGAMICAGQWVLLNRGAAKSTKAKSVVAGNAAIFYPLNVLYELVCGKIIDCEPSRIRRFDLGTIDQVNLSFTDCAALPDGSWLYTAVAEDAPDSYQDGQFLGAVIGKISPQGQTLWQRPLEPNCKVEGIAINVSDDGLGSELEICLVTDADQPSQPALMLKAQLNH
jgi:hypothetical protein